MEKTNRLREIVLGVFMVFTISFSFILLSYSDGNGEVGVTDKVIKIGCHLDLSGAAVGWGAGESKGLKAYMNYINDQGGIFGRKIEMIIEDDNYSPAKAVAATKKMIEQDKVFCFIGNLGSAPSLATYPIIEENKIPLLFAHNGANQHAYPPKKYDFALWTRYQDQMPILVDYAMKEFKTRKMGMIYQDDEAGKNCLDGTINGLKKYNLELVAAESHFRGSVDLSPQVNKMKAAGVEIIFLGNIHKQAALAMKEAAKLGYKPQFISGYIATDPITLELAGEAGDGSIHAGVWKNPEDENDPGVKEYQKIMNKYFPKERFSNATISGVLIAKVTAEAIKRTGKNLTREGLITALENMKNYDTGIAPPISFGPNNRLGYTAVYLYKAKNEKFVYLAGPLTSVK